ncbi:MAG: hypothetical protein AAF889_07140 [Cyanobacteria bacterium P01_D01_bin.73]
MEKPRRRRSRRRSRRSSLLFILAAVVIFAGAIGTGLAQALHPPIAPEASLSPSFLAVEAIGDEFVGRQELEQELLGQDWSSQNSPHSSAIKSGPGFAPDLPPADPEGTVDVLPASYWLARDLYRENCGTCHVAVPPATLPVQTWRELLTSEQHYGKVIQPPSRTSTSIIWSYIRDYSRPLREEEPIPYRLDKSRFFRSLHPEVPFPEPVRVNQCATCHPRAEFFNFRLFNNASQS